MFHMHVGLLLDGSINGGGTMCSKKALLKWACRQEGGSALACRVVFTVLDTFEALSALGFSSVFLATALFVLQTPCCKTQTR